MKRAWYQAELHLDSTQFELHQSSSKRAGTYLLFLKFEEGNSVGEEFDVVLSSFLRSSLLGKGVADLHGLSHVNFVPVLSIVLLLEAVDVVGHHHFVLLLSCRIQVLILVLVLLLSVHLVSRSHTVRSHLLLLHHLNRRVMYASQG